jgi:hypothetical protein
MIFSEERKLMNKKRNYYKFKTNILFFNQNYSLLRGWGERLRVLGRRKPTRRSEETTETT